MYRDRSTTWLRQNGSYIAIGILVIGFAVFGFWFISGVMSEQADRQATTTVATPVAAAPCVQFSRYEVCDVITQHGVRCVVAVNRSYANIAPTISCNWEGVP